MTKREQAAREAFYGNNPVLSDAILEKMSYEWDDTTYSANGATLAEYIAITTQMSVDEFDTVMALA
jgi:UV DNA damage repair endonuclease